MAWAGAARPRRRPSALPCASKCPIPPRWTGQWSRPSSRPKNRLTPATTWRSWPAEPPPDKFMLSRLTALLSGWATRRNVLLVVALDLVMNAALLPLASARLAVVSGAVGPFDNSFAYTPAQAYSALAAYGSAGRAFALSSELTLDLVYPVIYTLFFCLASLYFLQRAAPGRPALARLALIPFLALVADYLENAGLITLLLNYPAQLLVLAQATSLLTTLKWLLHCLSLALLAASAIGTLLARRQRATPAQP